VNSVYESNSKKLFFCRIVYGNIVLRGFFLQICHFNVTDLVVVMGGSIEFAVL